MHGLSKALVLARITVLYATIGSKSDISKIQ
jgi:hypothetical protein